MTRLPYEYSLVRHFLLTDPWRSGLSSIAVAFSGKISTLFFSSPLNKPIAYHEEEWEKDLRRKFKAVFNYRLNYAIVFRNLRGIVEVLNVK